MSFDFKKKYNIIFLFLSWGSCIYLYFFSESYYLFEQTILNSDDVKNKIQFHMHYIENTNEIMIYDLQGKVYKHIMEDFNQINEYSTLLYIYTLVKTDKDIEIRVDTDNELMIVKSTLKNMKLYFSYTINELSSKINDSLDIFSLFLLNCKKIDEEKKLYKNNPTDLKKMISMIWIYSFYKKRFKLYFTSKYSFFIYGNKIQTFKIDLRNFFKNEIIEINNFVDNYIFFEVYFFEMNCFVEFLDFFLKQNSNISFKSSKLSINSFWSPFMKLSNVFSKKLYFSLKPFIFLNNLNFKKIFGNDLVLNNLYLNEFRHEIIFEKYKSIISNIIDDISIEIYHSLNFHLFKIYMFKQIINLNDDIITNFLI